MYHKTRSQAYADLLSSPLWRIGQLAAVRAALQGNGCLTRVTADHGKKEAADDTSERQITKLEGIGQAKGKRN